MPENWGACDKDLNLFCSLGHRQVNPSSGRRREACRQGHNGEDGEKRVPLTSPDTSTDGGITAEPGRKERLPSG